MGPSPKPRSSSAATTSSRSPTSTGRSTGPRDAARRRLVDAARHAKVSAAAATALEIVAERAQRESVVFPDERLKLLFVCAHPALDEAARTPLMLQTVLGLDAARIATAFLVTPATMSQRLAPVKTEVRDARIPLEVPEPTRPTPR